MTGSDPELEMARARVVERGLTADAIAALTPLVRELPPETLTPVKQTLKQFFSDRPWTEADDEALADTVGAGGEGGEHELEPGLTLTWGWVDGRFRLRLENAGVGDDLGETFDGAVVPEATPSPRTIRFATPPIHEGPSRTFDSAESAAADPAVARLFDEFDEVNNVLVGPDFVAVTIARPDRWEALLAPMLRLVSESFTGDAQPVEEPEPVAPMTISFTAGSDDEGAHAPRRLERAWTELGALRADRPEHLERLVVATHDEEPARRQVGAALLADAPPEAARGEHGSGCSTIRVAPCGAASSTPSPVQDARSCGLCSTGRWTIPTPGCAGRPCTASACSASARVAARSKPVPAIPTFACASKRRERLLPLSVSGTHHVPGRLHRHLHCRHCIAKRGRVVGDPRFAGDFGAGLLEQPREVAELIGEPPEGIGLDPIVPDPIARLDPVERGVEVSAAEVAGRAVDLVEEIGAEERPVDDDPFGGEG